MVSAAMTLSQHKRMMSASSLSDLTAKVKEGHQQLRDRMKYIVVGAMAIGDDLQDQEASWAR